MLGASITPYSWLHAIAYLCMIIVVFEIMILLTIPLLGFGAGGLFGLRWARRRLAKYIDRARALPAQGVRLVDRACSAAAWPVIRATSLWRGSKVALAALRRQLSGE